MELGVELGKVRSKICSFLPLRPKLPTVDNNSVVFYSLFLLHENQKHNNSQSMIYFEQLLLLHFSAQNRYIFINFWEIRHFFGTIWRSPLKCESFLLASFLKTIVYLRRRKKYWVYESCPPPQKILFSVHVAIYLYRMEMERGEVEGNCR